MANIQMPIEIKQDNTIVPLQHMSSVYIESIIESISDIVVDDTLPDILIQANALFKCNEEIMDNNMDDSTEPSIRPNETPLQLWVRPEEIRKSIQQPKRNTSFKNRSKYNHRFTSKMRDNIDNYCKNPGR
jgi:hypothetical protein